MGLLALTTRTNGWKSGEKTKFRNSTRAPVLNNTAVLNYAQKCKFLSRNRQSTRPPVLNNTAVLNYGQKVDFWTRNRKSTRPPVLNNTAVLIVALKILIFFIFHPKGLVRGIFGKALGLESKENKRPIVREGRDTFWRSQNRIGHERRRKQSGGRGRDSTVDTIEDLKLSSSVMFKSLYLVLLNIMRG